MLIFKLMCWGDYVWGFVCLVYWLVLLYGVNVVEVELFGLQVGCVSCGYCFYYDQVVLLVQLQDYVEVLCVVFVLVDFGE